MSVVAHVREHINSIPVGAPFLAASLRYLASTENVRKILGRLVISGELKRVAPGIFVKPKLIPYIGTSIPSAQEIAQAIAKSTGETITIHGAEAARRLHLSTQTPMQLVYYTTGNTRKIKIGKQTITFKHISPRKITAFASKAGEAISALWYLGKENVTTATLNAVKKKLSEEEFNSLINEAARMPAWMANIFFHYQNQRAIHDK